MFHKVLDFVTELQETHGQFRRVLDVGSRNINGSVKDVLRGYEEFVGVDMIDGKDVDKVMNGHDLASEFPPNYFDLITCCETFEHDAKFWLTLEAMKTVLKPGGYLLITVPGINFFKHDFPSDYYRFTPEVFNDVFFEGFNNVVVKYYEDPADPNKEKPNNNIFGYGQKP